MDRGSELRILILLCSVLQKDKLDEMENALAEKEREYFQAIRNSVQKPKPVLTQLCCALEEDKLDEIESALKTDPDALLRFGEIRENNRPVSDKKQRTETARCEWPAPKLTTNRFRSLLDEYKNRYCEISKKNGGRGNLLDLYEEVEGAPKWSRMEKRLAVGNQFHDSVRLISLVCHLNCGELIDFLWTAGHPLTAGSLRDDVIAHCILKKIYEPEKVDGLLANKHQELLFQKAQDRKKKDAEKEAKKKAGSTAHADADGEE